MALRGLYLRGCPPPAAAVWGLCGRRILVRGSQMSRMGTITKTGSLALLLFSVSSLEVIGDPISLTHKPFTRSALEETLRYKYTTLQSRSITGDRARLERRIAAEMFRPQDLLRLAKVYSIEARRLRDFSLWRKAKRTAISSLGKDRQVDSDARVLIASTQIISHEFDRARRNLEIALLQSPEHVAATTQWLRLKLITGDNVSVHIKAEELVERAPSTDTYSLLAEALLARGTPDKAIHAYINALALEKPGDPERAARIRTDLAGAYFDRGEYDLARFALEEALRVHSGYGDAMALLAEIELAEGETEKAVELFRIAHARTNSAYYRAGIARAIREQGETKAAWRELREVEHELRKSVEQGYRAQRMELIRTLLAQKQKNSTWRAIRYLLKEVRERPSGEVYALLAKAYRRTPLQKMAHEYVMLALAKGHQTSDTYMDAHHIAQAQDMYFEAEAFRNYAHKLNPRTQIRRSKAK